MKYIRNNQYYDFDFELDSRYNIGTTYEDSLNGKFVLLSSEQGAFKEANPSASIKEVWNMELNAPYQPTLEEFRQAKIAEIVAYDTSSNVNLFTYNETPMWLDKSTRVGLVNLLNQYELLGRENISITYNDMQIEMSIDTAKLMLAQLEAYAGDCYDVTAKHRIAVKALTTIEEIKAFDITADYPKKLIFNI